MNPAVSRAELNTPTSSSRSSLCGVTRPKNGMRLVLVISGSHTLLVFNHSQNTRWISCDNYIRGNALGHHAARTHHSVPAHGHTRQDGCTRPDRSPLPNQRRLHLPIAFRLERSG